MSPKPGTRMPRPPETESEQLAFYRALHFLRESVVEEDAANDALIAVYRKQCEFIAEIRPFSSWEDIARILGTTSTIARARFRNYTNTAVKEFLDDGNE